jgi:hypothetical protein
MTGEAKAELQRIRSEIDESRKKTRKYISNIEKKQNGWFNFVKVLTKLRIDMLIKKYYYKFLNIGSKIEALVAAYNNTTDQVKRAKYKTQAISLKMEYSLLAPQVIAANRMYENVKFGKEMLKRMKDWWKKDFSEARHISDHDNIIIQKATRIALSIDLARIMIADCLDNLLSFKNVTKAADEGSGGTSTAQAQPVDHQPNETGVASTVVEVAVGLGASVVKGALGLGDDDDEEEEGEDNDDGDDKKSRKHKRRGREIGRRKGMSIWGKAAIGAGVAATYFITKKVNEKTELNAPELLAKLKGEVEHNDETSEPAHLFSYPTDAPEIEAKEEKKQEVEKPKNPAKKERPTITTGSLLNRMDRVKELVDMGIFKEVTSEMEASKDLNPKEYEFIKSIPRLLNTGKDAQVYEYLSNPTAQLPRFLGDLSIDSPVPIKIQWNKSNKNKKVVGFGKDLRHKLREDFLKEFPHPSLYTRENIENFIKKSKLVPEKDIRDMTQKVLSLGAPMDLSFMNSQPSSAVPANPSTVSTPTAKQVTAENKDDASSAKSKYKPPIFTNNDESDVSSSDTPTPKAKGVENKTISEPNQKSSPVGNSNSSIFNKIVLTRDITRNRSGYAR